MTSTAPTAVAAIIDDLSYAYDGVFDKEAVTDAVTIRSERFAFAMPVHGLKLVPKAGTLLATDGGADVRTPHDDCVLIMPTRKPKLGETAVRLGRFVD